jgi:hypothetical protein
LEILKIHAAPIAKHGEIGEYIIEQNRGWNAHNLKLFFIQWNLCERLVLKLVTLPILGCCLVFKWWSPLSWKKVVKCVSSIAGPKFTSWTLYSE